MGTFKGANRRRSVLSSPGAQLRMIIFFCVLAFVYASVNLYVSHAALKELSQQMREQVAVSDQQRHDVDLLWNQKSEELVLQVGLLTVLTLVMLLMGSLVVSHRAAGPVYHLEMYLKGRAANTIKRRNISFRRYDLFPALAAAFNLYQNRFDPPDASGSDNEAGSSSGVDAPGTQA